ncbi:AraC family transcriptional regulator [Streptomyces iconiensis]|uniref:AraC family transcriptional regulator n=1 Tax=Streptomyces iconiensis TaxID=1384038 RepID=A0ABT6ZNQ2_9ACTN|nr:AraC family transcriptional regulator [Streptomyces iconiensis]MDJ1130665.1 AraC family transcriptional regulator [Streptomyces iconiensis]
MTADVRSEEAETGDWARYWRAPDQPLEAMRAHFTGHVFHRHSHDAYSFAVTESGAQRFRCRGSDHTSGEGMVMAFNPDDPHDGESAVEHGFTYRIVHLGPGLVRSVLTDAAGADAPMPLFPHPVREDPVLRHALLGLYAALVDGPAAGGLVRDERLTRTVLAMVRRGARNPALRASPRAGSGAVRRARALLEDEWAEDISAQRLADAAGCSRFALYRAFRAELGVAPSEFQRQQRLRVARRVLARGGTAARAAAESGFADQSHLHRWFVRSYGITPGTYVRG